MKRAPPSIHDLSELISAFEPLVLNWIAKSNPNEPVVVPQVPSQVVNLLGQNILNDQPTKLEDLLVLCGKLLDFSVKTRSPFFANQLYTGSNNIGIISEWLTSVVHCTVTTFRVAPIFCVMERLMIQEFGKFFLNWENCDGTLCPGGSISNFISILLAIDKSSPNARKDGLYGGPRLTAYTSDQTHYSISRGCSLAGLGTHSLRIIDTDERGCMVAEKLEERILEDVALGFKPFYVCATAGSTVFGSFDPFHEVARISQKFQLWMHVDCSWGGGVFYAGKQIRKELGVDAISRANSIVLNPHKSLNVPQQCSVFLVSENGPLENRFSTKAPYLFSSVTLQESTDWNPGEKSINCARRNDIFKLFLSQKYFGTCGFKKLVKYFFYLRDYWITEMKKRPFFQVFDHPPQYLNVLFWVIPEQVMNLDPGQEKNELISKVTVDIGNSLRNSGKFMINFQSAKDLPVFFRMVFNNPNLTTSSIHTILDYFVEEAQNFDLRITKSTNS
eukprot:TRINITY_DN8383_c0_g1_i15.p1 TRINITY_DN8383_c0_g1~~TRINITY_DN8383_c0_g1_i15.p1  ORF type:complete len:502 (-),score=102.51 TRINITY_DN8383_c0_g1_i15:60-1565(-)